MAGSTGYRSYTVALVYTNDAGERSVDYMTFSVYCAAKKQENDYGQIKIEQSDGEGSLSGTSASVEQINAPSGSGFYEHTAELELQSWVEGAENTRVKWSYFDGGKWEDITGHSGDIPIKDGQGRIRATVEWMHDKQAYTPEASANPVFTGGAVRITGLDVNEYDDPFTFQLRSAAVEATENGDAIAAARTVTVTVMNKLRIEPQTFTGYSGSDITLSANRTDRAETGWTYNWQISPTGNTTFPDNAANLTEIKFKVNSEEERRVTLQYGPHTETAILRTVDGAWEFLATVNWDAQLKENGQNIDYFLVEKGDSKRMTNSWFVGSMFEGTIIDMARARMTNEPSPNGLSFATIAVTTGAGSTEPNSNVKTGRRYYTVTGKEFCDPQDITWNYQQGVLFWGNLRNPKPKYYTVKLAVVGMDITKNGEVYSNGMDLELERGMQTAVTADWSFPKELIQSDLPVDNRKPDIQWEISNTDLVDFVGGNTGENVVLLAKKYSAKDYTATLTATCTVHCTNDRTYTYKKHVSVVVPRNAAMTVTAEPCTAGDIAGLNKAFGDGLAAGSLLAAVDENGTPVLIRNGDFGCGTLYLKVRAQLFGEGGGAVGDADLNEYFCNLQIDRSFVDMDTALSDDGTAMYVRLRAKEATADGSRLKMKLNVSIGNAEALSYYIDLYDHPKVTLTRDGEDVTNGSKPVYQDNTNLSVTLQAGLTPVLYRADDTAREAPLDRIQWHLQAPEGYDAQSYLNMETDGAGAVTVSIRDENRMPDFRVVLHARSALSDQSDAGYALVFLPVREEEDTP